MRGTISEGCIAALLAVLIAFFLSAFAGANDDAALFGIRSAALFTKTAIDDYR